MDHFKDRFADQRWLIYDVKRQYGYYYNLTEMEEVTFEDPRQAHLVTGMLNETLMDNNERLFQELWKHISSPFVSKNVGIPKTPARYACQVLEISDGETINSSSGYPTSTKTRHVPAQNYRHYNDLYSLSPS